MSQIPLARRSPVPPDTCNLARAIDLIGDRWTLLILRAALYGVRRFDDFQSELGCPRTVLSGRLKKLVDAGLLTKKAYKALRKRARPEYVLSATGLSLRPILIGLTQWGDALAWSGRGAADQLYKGRVEKRYTCSIRGRGRTGSAARPDPSGASRLGFHSCLKPNHQIVQFRGFSVLQCTV